MALLLLAATPAAADEAGLARRILEAQATGEHTPMVSRVAPELDLESAYRVQQALVADRLESDTITGFKAGLTGRLDLSDITATLTREGERLSKGSGSDTMGDPWAAALWLVNAALHRGYIVEPGHVLSTGVLGERVEATPGRYVADFGALGRVAFEVR